MTTYKISKDNWSTLQNFNTLQECEDWVLSTLGTGYTITISDIPLTPPTPEQKLQDDLQFGHYLIDEFLLDNRLITPSVTPSESLQLLSEFSNIEKLASLGDIKSVSILLNGIQTDTRLFTQERKDKYINEINSHLNAGTV
jgi:hypothetical protein